MLRRALFLFLGFPSSSGCSENMEADRARMQPTPGLDGTDTWQDLLTHRDADFHTRTAWTRPRESWLLFPALLLTCCGTLGWSLTLSGVWFPVGKIGLVIFPYLTGLL